MSRMVGTTPARLRLPLAVLASGLVALLLPPSLSSTVGPTSAVVLMAVAVAALAVLVGRTGVTAPALPRGPAAGSRATEEPPPFLAARVTDPLHHPLRPRAPGLV